MGLKVDIKHSELKEGLIFKTRYSVVEVHLQLSDTEKAIVKKNKMKNLTIVERPGPANRGPRDDRGQYAIPLSAFVGRKPNRHVAADDLEAKDYENEMLKTLSGLKEIFDDTGDGLEDKSFEL